MLKFPRGYESQLCIPDHSMERNLSIESFWLLRERDGKAMNISELSTITLKMVVPVVLNRARE